MKYPSCLYLEATQLNFCFKRPSLSSFWGDAIIQVQHQPSDQTTAPSETHINQHKKRPNKGFPPQPSTILASSKIYKKLCSNGLDLVESNINPRIRQQPPQKPILINMTNARIRVFFRNQGRFWPQAKHTKSSAQTALISLS
jgi:hypothetical protein